MDPLSSQFYTAALNNDVDAARKMIAQLVETLDAQENCDQLYDLIDCAVEQGRVEIAEIFVRAFKDLGEIGRILGKYTLYASFRKGQLPCAENLQQFYPSEIFFCISRAVKDDHVHMLERFLPQFNPDITDLTRLLIEAWDCNSVRCFAYVLPQCSYLDGDAMAARFRFSVDDNSTEFCAHFHAQRQKLVLEEQVNGGRERVRKM